MTTLIADLQALVERWRITANIDPMEDDRRWIGHSDGMDQCADELSAILSRATSGEVSDAMERHLFEQWVPSAYRSLRNNEVVDFDGDFSRYEDDHPESGQYVCYLIEGAWSAWQARAALESLTTTHKEQP